jgi:hypothetical protein
MSAWKSWVATRAPCFAPHLHLLPTHVTPDGRPNPKNSEMRASLVAYKVSVSIVKQFSMHPTRNPFRAHPCSAHTAATTGQLGTGRGRVEKSFGCC